MLRPDTATVRFMVTNVNNVETQGASGKAASQRRADDTDAEGLPRSNATKTQQGTMESRHDAGRTLRPQLD
jgi:hypothetical protein